jgi:membrane protein
MSSTSDQKTHEAPKKNIISTILSRSGRVVYDAARGFIEDDCYSKASALTFYTLLSVVPVLAVLIGIAKGFGFEHALESEISSHFYEQQEVVDKLIQFAYSWLKSAQGGVIAGVGTAALLWSVFGLLNNIETALNAIWKTSIPRPYTRKISDYLAAMLIAPIFLVTSSGITVFLSTQLLHAQENILVEAVSPLLTLLIKMIPFVLIWCLFIFVYLFMPNTKVFLRSAAIAGILAGTAFQIWQYVYIKFQIGVSSYGAIYGSFAALPLFLIWLQVSWLILLAGAELAFEIENDLFVPVRTRDSFPEKTIALMITYRCIEAFIKGKPPHTDRSLSHELGLSLNHMHMILEALQKARILTTISYRDKTIGYQPARAVDSITMQLVCDAIEKSHEIMASPANNTQMEKIIAYGKHVNELLEDPKTNHVIYTYIT